MEKKIEKLMIKIIMLLINCQYFNILIAVTLN